MSLKKVISAPSEVAPVTSVLAARKRELSPGGREIDTYVSRPTQMVIHMHTVTALGKTIELPIRFPLPPSVNKYSDVIESKIESFVSEFGLYKGMESLVSACRFAFLSGLVSPFSSESCQEGLSFYYTALFDHDDCIDLHTVEGEINPDALQDVNDRLELILAGHAAKPTDLPRIKAIANIYETYFGPIIDGGAEFEYARTTLHEYLQSTVQEARHIQGKAKIQEGVYLEHRQHTGGIRHAFAIMCLLEGINISCLLKKYINLQFMLRQVADAVGVLNDILSFEKELRELRKKNPDISPTDHERLKGKVTSNLVLIKWRDGMSFEDSINHSRDIYEMKLDAFYGFKAEVAEFLIKDPALRKITFLLEGWLFGHPGWALNIRRYNQAVMEPLTIASASQFIRGLTNQSAI